MAEKQPPEAKPPLASTERIIGVLLITAAVVLFIYGLAGESPVTCNKPYIHVGVDCCLDINDNGICDSAECIPGSYFAMDSGGACMNFTTSCMPRGWTRVDKCPIATCFDGIRDCHDGACETDVDQGGPCKTENASCFDGIKNQNEEGVDCGGVCPPCLTRPQKASCFDALVNCHDGACETGVDCGGPCPPCLPTCSDGVQNQGETGVDCGGACPPCPKPVAPEWVYSTPSSIQINEVRLSNDSGFVIAGSYDNFTYFFNAAGVKLWDFDARESVEHVGLSASGDIAAASAGVYVYFFRNATTRSQSSDVRRYRMGDTVNGIYVRPDGTFVAAGSIYENSTAGNNYLFYFNTSGMVTSSTDLGRSSSRVKVSSNGYGVIDGGFLYLNGAGSPVDLGTKFGTSSIVDVEFALDGNAVAVSPSKLYFIDAAGRVKWSRDFSNARHVAVSERGDDVVVGSDNVYLFRSNGTLAWEYNTSYNVSLTGISRTGAYVMVATEDRYLSVLNNSGSLLWKYFVNSRITAAGFSEDENYLAVGTFNGEVYLLKTRQEPS
jgi:hypothetical protein